MTPTTKPTKPTKPTNTLYCVYRGGSWNNYAPWWVRAESRDSVVPAVRYSYIGFRCALRAREPRV